MQIDTHRIDGNGAFEMYITASATPGKPVKGQAEEVFSAIRDTLESGNARILQERVFGTEEALEVIARIRANEYGRFDDGLEPTWLIVPEGINGPIAGVQMHAVGGAEEPAILRLEHRPCGRIVRIRNRRCLTLSGICAPEAGAKSEQARRMLEKAEAILRQAGADMGSVVRTWMWLGQILYWYGDFNAARSQFFTERGLIGKKGKTKMPASTGIGVRAKNNGICTMDLIAVIEPDKSIEYLDAGGNQPSAFGYGSAFSRASKANTLAGETFFVSGTASIDRDGQTVHIGQAEAQMKTSIDNVQAVLTEMNCSDSDVVQATVYCKTAEIEKIFCDKWSDFPWPHFTAIADICRDELLFEVEATAMVAS